MKIMIDIGRLERRRLRNTPTGVDRVILAYALEFLSKFPKNTIFTREFLGKPVPYKFSFANKLLLETKSRWSEPNKKTSKKAKVFESTSVFVRSVTDFIFYALSNPIKKGIKTLYFCLDHNGLLKKGVVENLSILEDVETIAILHDLIPITHPEYVRPRTTPIHAQRMLQLSKHSNLVVANSEYTKYEFEEYLKSKNLNPPNTITIPLGIDSTVFFDTDKLISKQSVPYFVTVGTIEARKNHITLLNIWRRFFDNDLANIPELHIVGRRGWEAECVEDMLDRCPALSDKVFEHSSISDLELQRLYSGAKALLFPSHVEGFGLPLAEALARGVPAIVSDIPAFREVGGNVPEFIDPLDTLSWANIILDYAQPASFKRDAQIDRIANHLVFDWDMHFRILFQYLKSEGHMQ